MTPEEWARYVREIGYRVRMAREAVRVSQEDLASAARIATLTVQRVEAGHDWRGRVTNPSSRTLLSIAKVLEVSPREFFPEEL